MSTRRLLLTLVLLAGCFTLGPVLGAAEDEKKPVTSKEAAAEKEKFARFQKEMTGTKLVGQFTVVGQPQGALAKEEYTILSVKKVDQSDLWVFKARIKYGKQDITLPVPVPIKWAGKTPVIEMDNLKIPLLGTFSAHIVIDDGKYAGTWKHGKVGGHMFGSILKIEK